MWTNGPTGYKIIEDLHNSSTEPEFDKARRLSEVRFVPDVLGETAGLLDDLQNKVAALCVTIAGGSHGVVVAARASGLYIVDPLDARTHKDLTDLNALPATVQDGLIVIRR